jgi:CheY-like chemotaxis protein
LTGSAHRIFVIEDEEMIRESIVEFLAENGYDAVGAAHGREALDKLSALPADPPPCLILLDLMMPIMDGRTFRERQLESPNLAAIPIIVVSAYRDLAKTAVELRAVGHLEKPLRLPDLLRTVRRYCATEAGPSGHQPPPSSLS